MPARQQAVYVRCNAMNDTDTIELKNIDSEDISDVLAKIEKSFGFKFGDTELKDVLTFGELCDIITNKVDGDNLYDCTTQQAFYKLRNVIAKTGPSGKRTITAKSDLEILFPRSTRRQQLSFIDLELGFKLKILRPKHWLTGTLILTFVISLLGLFVSWQIGLTGMVASFFGLALADKFANELDIQNMGQLANKVSREHYLKARTKAGTINKTEIAELVKDLFSHDLDLDKSALTKEAVFV